MVFFSPLFISCSQKGCPGGMCAPDHYYASPKKLFRKSLTARTNKARHINYHKYNRQLMRMARYKNKQYKKFSIEYTSRWADFNTGSRVSTDIESGTFKMKREKKPKNMAMQRAKRYKEPGKVKGHQEGLWPPEMRNYPAQLTKRKKKQDTTREKQNKGTKKIKQ